MTSGRGRPADVRLELGERRPLAFAGAAGKDASTHRGARHRLDVAIERVVRCRDRLKAATDELKEAIAEAEGQDATACDAGNKSSNPQPNRTVNR